MSQDWNQFVEGELSRLESLDRRAPEPEKEERG